MVPLCVLTCAPLEIRDVEHIFLARWLSLYLSWENVSLVPLPVF